MFNTALNGVAIACARVKAMEARTAGWIAAHPRLALSLALLSIVVAVIL